jgi:hypothetical protein
MPDEHIKRCDVRVPIEIYNQIEKIAVNEYNVPLYHKTGKPQVSSTIIELLKLGIAALNGDLSDKVSGSVSDVIPDNLSDRLQAIESKLSDTLSDNFVLGVQEKLETSIEEIIKKKIDRKTDDLIHLFQSEFQSFEVRFEGIEAKLTSENVEKTHSIPNKPITVEVAKTVISDEEQLSDTDNTIRLHSQDDLEGTQNGIQVVEDIIENKADKTAKNDEQILSDRETNHKAIEFAKEWEIEYEKISKLPDKKQAEDLARRHGYEKTAFTRDIADKPKDFARDYKVIRIDTGSSNKREKYHFFCIE